MPAEFALAECARTHELTEAPFGINLIIAEDPEASDQERAADVEYFRSAIAAADAGGASAVVLFWGDPEPFVSVAHEQGLKVLIQVGSLEEGRAAVAAGVDAVIAQGIEAGGHVGGRARSGSCCPRWRMRSHRRLSSLREASATVPALRVR